VLLAEHVWSESAFPAILLVVIILRRLVPALQGLFAHIVEFLRSASTKCVVAFMLDLLSAVRRCWRLESRHWNRCWFEGAVSQLSFVGDLFVSPQSIIGVVLL